MSWARGNPKVVAIVQARMASSRLPGKIMADMQGRPLLDVMLARVARAELVDDLWVATSTKAQDDAIDAFCASKGVHCFRGDEADVLSRISGAAAAAEADVVVRLTADCPFADPGVIDAAVAQFRAEDVDYLSNVVQRTFPDGLDVEVFTRATLERTVREATLPALREHVTVYMRSGVFPHYPSGKFRMGHLVNAANFSHLRWTVDRREDLAFVRAVLPRLKEEFSWLDLVALLTRDAELLQYNRRHRARRPAIPMPAEGAPPPRVFVKSDSEFERASRTIPLATQTFSKSHMQWVRGAAPLFVERAHGCRFTDIDGNHYIDYVLGLLPVVLGYGDADVDAAIVAQLEKGIVFSLAHPLEAELAERLTRLIPCAEMVRFGKNGSDATSAAIRLARAYTGRDRIAICGYHGWHDWYIGTTSRHLGVPDVVRKLSTTFPYNDADALERLLRQDPQGYAAIILEPAGVEQPAAGFLERVRGLADHYGVVLVFDEIITGFRLDLGGAQKRYGVVPDLACFGKAMANGMPIAAIVGRAAAMRLMESIFFSGTMGGEALSLAAAVATVDKLERENVIERLWQRGAELRDEANQSFERHGFGGTVKFGGEGWWPRLKLANPPVEANLLNSLLRQEFAANGLLLGASFNLCLAHDDDIVVAETRAAIDHALAAVRAALDSPDPRGRLRGVPIQSVFSVR